MEKIDCKSMVDEASGAHETREMLAHEFGIKAAFARVDQLAALTGMSSSAIRSQARSGLFPIPHRKVGKAILFKVEAVLAWYCQSELVPPPQPAARVESTPSHTAPSQVSSRNPQRIPLPLPGVSLQDAARVKQQVLERIAARRAGNVSGARSSEGSQPLFIASSDLN